jgi:hypothetical protein
MIEAGHLEKAGLPSIRPGDPQSHPASLENVMFMYQTAQGAIGEFKWSVCAPRSTR